MNPEAFNDLKWSAGMRAVYKEKTYNVTSVNFEERLVELESEPDDCFWVRFESLSAIFY